MTGIDRPAPAALRAVLAGVLGLGAAATVAFAGIITLMGLASADAGSVVLALLVAVLALAAPFVFLRLTKDGGPLPVLLIFLGCVVVDVPVFALMLSR